MRICSLVFSALLPLCAAPFAGPAFAQKTPDAPQLPDLLGQGDGLGGFGGDVQVSAELKPAKAKAGETVTLSVTLVLPPGTHTYPQTAKTAIPTKIRVKHAAGLEPLGKRFTPVKPPKQKVDPDTKEKSAIFEGIVTWTRKFKVKEIKSSGISIDGSIRYQICTQNSCKPPRTQAFATKATAAGSAGAEQPVAPKQTSTTNTAADEVHPFSHSETPKRGGKADPLTLKFELKPKNAKPGDEVTASITAKIGKGWHAYALTHPKGGTGLPVVIRVSTLKGLEPAGKGWRSLKAPKLKSEGDRVAQEHEGTVTWSRKFAVAKSAAPGGYGISGSIKYQICKAVCLVPKRVKFSLGDLNGAKPAPKSASDIDRTPFPKSGKPSKGVLVYALILLLAIVFSAWLLVAYRQPDMPARVRWLVGGTAAAIVMFAATAGSQQLEKHETGMTALLQQPLSAVAAGTLLGTLLGGWLWRTSIRTSFSTAGKWLLRAVAAALVLGIPSVTYAATTTVELPWQEYSEQRLNAALDEGRIVMVDFTADW